MEEYGRWCQHSFPLCLWERRRWYLPWVYPSKLSLNEINKFRLNWQLASKVIIPPLMSPHWNGRRLGLRGNTTGCGQAVFSNTKKWRVTAARVYLSRILYTQTETHTHSRLHTRTFWHFLMLTLFSTKRSSFTRPSSVLGLWQGLTFPSY